MTGSIFAGLAQEAGAKRRGISLERMLLEGEPWSTAANFAGTLSGTAQSLGSFSLPTLGKAFYIEQLTISSNRQIDVQAQFQVNLTGQGHTHRHIVYPGVPLVVPVRALVRPAYANVGNAVIGGLTSKAVIDATPTGATVYATASGIGVYDDFNLTADKVALWIGDSVTNDTTGITSKITSYHWLLRERLRALGYDIRFINKSISGTTSVDHEKLRAYGTYVFPQVDLICYSLGVNDAGNAVPTATYTANLNALIAWKKSRYPNATLLIFGTTPLENNTSETAAVALRSAASSAVTSAADSKIRYCNLGAAFDRTQGTTVYTTTDSAGSRVHPNDTGHAAIDAVVGTYLAGSPLSL